MQSYQITPRITFTQLLEYEHPQAAAWINGNASYPNLSGLVKFYQTAYNGILVEAEIFHLPDPPEPASGKFYAMHIHEFGDCSDQFSKTGSHLNLTKSPHPMHTGDMPPLLSSQGYAWITFYDKRFTLDDIIDKSIIIHSNRDDFTTQPSGDSGDKIGCGVIKRSF